jgi:serine/threonine protein phosphatase PrpC
MTEAAASTEPAPPEAPPPPPAPDAPEAGAPEAAAPEAAAAPAAEPAAEPERVVIRLGGVTDVGRIREHNEDNLLIADLTARGRIIDDQTSTHTVGPRGVLLAVCDGMGGAAAGEVASQMAVDVVHTIVQDAESPADRDRFAQRLVAAVQEAGARIFLAAKSNRERRGMGTTATVVGVYGSTLFAAQVGDSRAYLLRGGRLRMITRDQSLVSKLIDAGQLTEDEAETYEHAHIILQALGTADTVSVDLSYIDLCKGDVVMLCSDGLSGLASFEQIADAMANVEDPVACCHRLIECANDGGGHDNITVIIARFEGALPDATPDDLTVAYQPYVLLEPVESIIGASASTSMKLPDMPPPGSDVKHSLSMPPDMPSVMRVQGESPGEPPFVLDAAMRRELGLDATRNTLAWVLLALALAVLGLAAYIALRPHAAAPTEQEAPAGEAPAATPEPTPVGQGTPVPGAAQPAR